MSDSRLYKTASTLCRTVRVIYPAGRGMMTLATELDWNQRLAPIAISDDGTESTFEVAINQPYLYFKPCLIVDGETRWSVGANFLALMTEHDERPCHPFFNSAEVGRFTPLLEIPSRILDRPHRLRVFVPPGYDENTLATYPIVYMQDGQNLFFPEEAFLGQDWSVDETSQTLRTMRAVDDLIVVGLHSGDRMRDYTKPGYESYAKALVEEVLPLEASKLRGRGDRRYRTVWGSSLGGVMSFYAAFQHHEHFGSACCMSSTFSHRDDLIERVLTEPKRDVGFYLDSGWPGDNYEVTMAMATALISRGWRYGKDLIHLVYPAASHNESAWGVRLHIPFQFFYGATARASRLLEQRSAVGP